MQQSLLEEDRKKTVPKSIFKSACQKHIRRGNVEGALKCAKANIEQDAHDFSRRVMVLAPEEVTIHPLMVQMVEINQRLSKKGNEATDLDKNIMLTIVRDCAAAEVRDSWEYREQTSFELTQEVFDYFPDWQKNIIRALKYRGSIGGMSGDLKMFRNMVNYISEKWVKGEPYTYEMFYKNINDVNMVDHTLIEMPTKDDIPYYSVDFHCFPPISRLCLYKPKWVNGEKISEPTAYKTLIDGLKGKTEKPVKSIRKMDSDDDEWVKKIMWLYEASTSYKKDYRSGEPLDSIKADGVTDHDKKIFDICHETLIPIWKGVVDWYLGQYYNEDEA